MSDLQLHTINGIQLDNKWNNQKFINIYLLYWKYRNKRQRYSQKMHIMLKTSRFKTPFSFKFPSVFDAWNGVRTDSQRSQNEGRVEGNRGQNGFR